MILETMMAAAIVIAAPEPPPRWFGEDKLKHLVASFVVTSLSTSVARAAGVDRTPSISIGAGVGAASGFIKEIQDRRRGAAFSGYDLLWDAAGVGVAVLLFDASS